MIDDRMNCLDTYMTEVTPSYLMKLFNSLLCLARYERQPSSEHLSSSAAALKTRPSSEILHRVLMHEALAVSRAGSTSGLDWESGTKRCVEPMTGEP
jgi:hypothetical protein